jgi:hypothetical protein
MPMLTHRRFAKISAYFVRLALLCLSCCCYAMRSLGAIRG